MNHRLVVGFVTLVILAASGLAGLFVARASSPSARPLLPTTARTKESVSATAPTVKSVLPTVPPATITSSATIPPAFAATPLAAIPATATMPPRLTDTPRPTPTLSATTAVAASPSTRPESPSPTPIQITQSSVIGNTNGQGVYLRHNPIASDIWYPLTDGSRVTVVGTVRDSRGWEWDHVRDSLGDSGWVLSRYVIAGSPSGEVASAPAVAPTPLPQPGSSGTASATKTPSVPSVTPTATPSPSPTSTPTPAFDYVVQALREVPVPGNRKVAYIRGSVVDRNGQMVPGVQFEIQSDAVPPWTAVGPPVARADGTVTFPVTRGRFIVRVLGGRSEDAGWMVTGAPGNDTMSDWEFVFQAIR